MVGPEVVASIPAAPWLPPGGRAEVVRASAPRRPTCLVRLLLRRDGAAFCVPRETGVLDLPTREVGADDADGRDAARRLAIDVVGGPEGVRHVGYVENVVPVSAADYPWPVPRAFFSVWTVDAAPIADGTWVDVAGGDLVQRHWFALIADSVS